MRRLYQYVIQRQLRCRPHSPKSALLSLTMHPAQPPIGPHTAPFFPQQGQAYAQPYAPLCGSLCGPVRAHQGGLAKATKGRAPNSIGSSLAPLPRTPHPVSILPACLTLKDHQIARCGPVCPRHGGSIFRIRVASPCGVQTRKLDKQNTRCVPALQQDGRCLAFDEPRSIAAGDRRAVIPTTLRSAPACPRAIRPSWRRLWMVRAIGCFTATPTPLKQGLIFGGCWTCGPSAPG